MSGMTVRRWFGSERGAILPFFALCVTMIMGVCAISLDAGVLYVNRNKTANIADASALAGCVHLPDDPDTAIDVATDLAVANGVDASYVSVSVVGDGDELEVSISQPVKVFFASVLGFGDQMIAVSSTACVASPTRVKGLAPFGVENQELEFGQLATLKLSASSEDGSDQGNFHALSLGEAGAPAYIRNIKYGYASFTQVGETLTTEPGNMKGPTEEGVSYRLNADLNGTYLDHLPNSPRLVLVPMIDSFDVSGRKDVTIRGFASFFLEGITADGDVTGRFIRRIVAGDLVTGSGAPDYGTRSLKLVKRQM